MAEFGAVKERECVSVYVGTRVRSETCVVVVPTQNDPLRAARSAHIRDIENTARAVEALISLHRSFRGAFEKSTLSPRLYDNPSIKLAWQK